MNNRNEIYLAVDRSDQIQYREPPRDGVVYHADGEGALEELRFLLEAYGCEVETLHDENGGLTRLLIRCPDVFEARRLRNRGGGRPPKGLPEGSPLGLLSGRQELEWLESHTVEEGVAALGVTVRTYYRRLAALRKRYPPEE